MSKNLFRKQRRAKAEFEKIIDFSNIRRTPERLPFHWCYMVFFALALTSSLWQHGHPVLTISLLALLIPLGALAYLPYRLFSSPARFYLQLAAVAASGIWFVFRLKHKVPIDKALIESVCVLGLCFILAQRAADYEYLFLISIFLLLYGALLPRAVFILAFLGAFVLAAFLLYSTRIKSLSGQGGLRNPGKILRRNWPLYIMHLGIALAVFWFVFSLFPTESEEGQGLFEVSFRTENENVMPPGIRNWFSFRKAKKSPRGKMLIKTGTPNSIGRRGAKLNLKKGQYMSSSGDGGSSPPGKEIIFRVKSPVKLYWLAQLYDQYDGVIWTISKTLKKSSPTRARKLAEKVINYSVTQNFIIEKWLSPTLYAAYRPISYDTFSTSRKIVKLKDSSYNATLAGKKYPGLPFKYTVNSILYVPELDPAMRKNKRSANYWIENTRRSKYLELPRSKISRRVRLLAKRLTMEIQDPFKKAITLRDYLRKNFNYKQYSKRVPPGKEAVDYFLFELHEGHCEYFASALAVLARLCGLPARVATGFSPGNYNALNKYFEVHAYHAHAWTQIFIDGMGWLTFDATPPGSVTSRTTPFGIGSLRDPFGDSWRVMPPEMTSHTLEHIRQGHFEKLERERSSQEYSTAEKMLLKAAELPEQAKEKFNSAMNSLFKNKEDKKNENILDRIKNGLKALVGRAGYQVAALVKILNKNWKLLLPLLAVLAAVIMEVYILKTYLGRKRFLDKCRRMYDGAQKQLHDDPAETVYLCYLTVRNLLKLAGMPRQKNMELLDYGVSLEQVDHMLCKNTVILFYFFSKQEYGAQKPTAKEAEEALKRTCEIREFIYPRINEAGELVKSSK